MADMLRYDTHVLDMVAKDLSHLGAQISACGSAVSSIAAQLDRESGAGLKISSSIYLKMENLRLGDGTIVSCLNQYARALNQYQITADRLGANVRLVSDMFVSTEKRLASLAIETGNANFLDTSVGAEPFFGDSLSNLDGPAENEEGYDWMALILKIIGKAGPTGSIISALVDLSSGTPDKLLNYIVKAGDTSVKWAKGLFDSNLSAKDYAKDILGLSEFLKEPSTASGWSAFKQNFGNSFKSGMTKPVSWITAGITSAYKNYVEFGGKFTDRVVVEWATETASTVAIGSASVALVGAGFAAAGIAAPALVVGACGVIVYAGVDALWSHTLGNGTGIVESIGHVVGEVYDGAKDFVGDVYDGAKDFVGDVYDGAKDFVGDVYDGAKDFISDASDWIGDKMDGLVSGLNISALWA